MWYIWLGIIILLSLIESIATKTIWFILSAITSFVLSFFINSFFIQFLVFIIVGLFLLDVYREKVVQKEEELFDKILPHRKKKTVKKSAKKKKK